MLRRNPIETYPAAHAPLDSRDTYSTGTGRTVPGVPQGVREYGMPFRGTHSCRSTVPYGNSQAVLNLVQYSTAVLNFVQ